MTDLKNGPLVAAALRLDERPGAELDRQIKRHEKWQSMVNGLYDEVPEIHYACNISGDALAKANLYVAVDSPDAEAEPIPVEDAGIDGVVATTAREVLDDLKAPVGGQQQIVRAAGINTMLAGEWYLIEVTEGDWAGWHVRGVEEIKKAGDSISVKGLGEFPLDQVSRVWQPHPRKFEAADSGLRACIGQAETILLIDRQFRAGLRSRLFAGLLLLSNGFKTGTPDPTTDTSGDGEGTDDPLISDLVTALTQAIQSEGSASAVVPNMLWGAIEDVKDGARILSFAQQADPALMELREKCLRRIAQGLDMPPEIVLGMGDINHWGQWFVGESFVQHIEPKADFLADAFTVVYLRPETAARLNLDVENPLIQQLHVRADLTPLQRRPNADEDARYAYEKGELSGKSLRKALGLGEDDAPDNDALVRWLLLNKSALGPQITAELLREVTAISVDVTPEPAPAPVEDQPVEEPNSPPAEPVAAAGGASLGLIDALLAERLFAAALATFRRALEKAGHRARGTATASARAELANVPAYAIPARLSSICAATGDPQPDDDDLLAGALAGLAVDFERWVGQADRRALDAAILLADEEPDDDEIAEVEAAQARARAAAWEWFAGASLALLHASMTAGSDVRDWQVRALVRQALARAGGADELAPVHDPTAVPTGGTGVGLAVGPLLLGLLARNGRPVVGWTWIHGEPEHPFPPHEDLDGDTGESILDFDGYEPGDHDGCTCSLEPIFQEAQE